MHTIQKLKTDLTRLLPAVKVHVSSMLIPPGSIYLVCDFSSVLSVSTPPSNFGELCE